MSGISPKIEIDALCGWFVRMWPVLLAILSLTAWLAQLEARVGEAQRSVNRSDASVEYIRRQNEVILKDLGVLAGDVKVVRRLLEIHGFRYVEREQ